MIETIINFLKSIFGNNKETTASEVNLISTNVLINNTLQGYKVIHLALINQGSSIDSFTIKSNESITIPMMTVEKIKELTLKCDIQCEDSSQEIIKGLSCTIDCNNQSQFITINITPTLLKLNAITFNTTIENIKHNDTER